MKPHSFSSRANDTIAAIASPPGSASRGVIRVSGPRARELVAATWRVQPSSSILTMRENARADATLELGLRALLRGHFDDGRGTQPVLLVWMQGPRSFTREDVAEFHLPGHPALLEAALARLVALGARVAEPGEFTRRAFHAGRIDLTRAEGVLALVFASNADEARSARALLFGGLEERVVAARASLVDVRTLVEASLDFDENDTGHVPAREIEVLMTRATSALDLALVFETQRAPSSGLPRVVLCGAPNAGKSALFNALSGGDALVTEHAGTTRDVLEAQVTFGHATATLIDTAGIEDAASGPEGRAQVIAAQARTDADVSVWVVDGSTAQRDEVTRARGLVSDAPVVLAWHKSDIAGRLPDWTGGLDVGACVEVSSRTGDGIEGLRRELARELARVAGGRGREIFQRHERALREAREELVLAREGIEAGNALELVAEHLRRATEALDRVSGGTTPEDVLDRIFAAFCLGK